MVALLTHEERLEVARATQEVEKTTAGEVVPMIVSQSDDYVGARWRLAVSASLLVDFIFYLVWPDLSGIWYLVFQFPAIFFGYWLSSFSVLKRLFITQPNAAEEVHQRAIQEFFSRNLHTTRARNAILIFVSLLEHRVEILGDIGIHERVPSGTWDQVVRELTAGIRSGKLVPSLCQAIRDCGRRLSEHFPVDASHNPNELGDEPVEG